MVTSKSPKRVLQYAWLAGDLVLKPYSHRFSLHKFTQAQLFACLVLKEFLQLDCRKVERLLGSALRARRYWNQMREIYLRTLTLKHHDSEKTLSFSTEHARLLYNSHVPRIRNGAWPCLATS